MDNQKTKIEWLTPAQMTQTTGVSIETLRYYEKENLIQAVQRSASGHRRYSSEDVLWVQVLRCLRETGMSIDQLRIYCSLGEQGDHTEPTRLDLLVQHKLKVEVEMQKMQESLKLIDHKIEYYEQSINQKKEHS